MSHWHKAPRTISVRSLIQRSAQCILIDWEVEIPALGCLRALSKETEMLCNLDPEKKLSRVQIARLCQEMRGLLLSTDSDMISVLITEGRAPWGAILLPEGRQAQADALERLASNQLVVRPSGDQGFMAEYLQQNRMLLDLRQSEPTIAVFSSCRWNRNEQ